MTKVTIAKNAAGAKIKLGPKGEADTVYPDPGQLDALDAGLDGQRARQVAPGVYIVWRTP